MQAWKASSLRLGDCRGHILQDIQPLNEGVIRHGEREESRGGKRKVSPRKDPK